MEGPHQIPQPDQERVAVSGRTLDSRQSTTLLAIYYPDQEAWVVYLDTDPKRAVVVGRIEMREFVTKLGRRDDDRK